MTQRGAYRSLYGAFWDDPDLRALSHVGYRLLTTLKGTLPATGIGFVLDDLLAQRCAFSASELEAAYAELERRKSGDRFGWIVRERNVVWLVNGLRFEPSIRPSDAKHRAHVAECLSQFGGEQSPLRVVREFRTYYAEWFVDGVAGDEGPVSVGASPSKPRRTSSPSRPRKRLTKSSPKDPSNDPPEGAELGSSEGSKEGSRLAQHNTTLDTTKKRTTWLTPFLEAWLKRFSTEYPPDRLARELKNVRKALGDQECLARWNRYLDRVNDPEFANGSSFAKAHSKYVGVAPSTTGAVGGTSTAADGKNATAALPLIPGARNAEDSRNLKRMGY